MPESRSSLWMNIKIGLAGLGVVMGTTVFFVFRFVKTFEGKTYYKGIYNARQCLLLSHLVDCQLPVREHPRRPLGSRQRHPLRHRSPSAPSLLEPQVGLTTMLFQRDRKYFLFVIGRRPTWHTVHSLAANRNLGILTLAFRFSDLSFEKSFQPTTFLSFCAISVHRTPFICFNLKSCSIGATVYYVYTALSEHQPVYPIENR